MTSDQPQCHDLKSKNVSGCLLPLVAALSFVLFLGSLGLIRLLFLMGAGLSPYPSFEAWFGAVMFCGYFGLIFVSCLPIIRGRLLLMGLGVVITGLDVFWSIFLVLMFSKQTANYSVLGLLLIFVFIGMNALWFKAVKGRLKF